MLSVGAALFMEMGTGKSKSIIDVAQVLHASGLIRSVVVLAPLSIVDTWCGEEGQLATHATPETNHWGALIGNKAQKLKAMEAVTRSPAGKLRWYAINIEGIAAIREELEELNPDMVVIDESTTIKNRTAQRSQLVTDLFSSAPHKVILSGNPTPKGAEEIFSQYLFADPGVFGSRFVAFRERYFEQDYFGSLSGFKSKEAEAEYQQKFHSIAFVKRKNECLDLPPKVYEALRVEMTPEQKQMYRDMYKDALASYQDHTCAAPVIITKMLRCSQIAGGFFPTEDGLVLPLIPNGKLAALVDVIEETTGQVVVWARFQKEIEMIEAKLNQLKVPCLSFFGKTKYKDRVKARSEFKAGNIKVFIANPATGGKGLNDLVGANTVVFYSNDYSAENRQQAEDRTHRSGTKGDKVTYIDIISKGTVDELVLKVLRTNKDFSDALLARELAMEAK